MCIASYTSQSQAPSSSLQLPPALPCPRASTAPASYLFSKTTSISSLCHRSWVGGASSLLFTNCPARTQTAGLLQAATSKRIFQPCQHPFPSWHLWGQALVQLLLRRASLSFNAKTPKRGLLASRLLQLGQPCVGGEEGEGSRSLERCPRLLPHTHPLPSPSRFSGYLEDRAQKLPWQACWEPLLCSPYPAGHLSPPPRSLCSPFLHLW